MRFAQGKEAERLIREGVRTLSAQEKRRLGLSATNTYYVRRDLRRVTLRAVVLSSRQARQARQRLGFELSEVARRTLGVAGRLGGLNAVLRRNLDYMRGRIRLNQARNQFESVVRLSGVSSDVLVGIINWRKGRRWYVRNLRDGATQLVLSWSSGERGIPVVDCIGHLTRIIESLSFNLISYSVEIVSKGSWRSTVTVEREVAVNEINLVFKILSEFRAGERISEGDLGGIYLYYLLVNLLIGYASSNRVLTFLVRVTW